MDDLDEVATHIKSGLEELGLQIGKSSEAILSRSSVLCKTYGLDSEEFVDSWMAFAATGSHHELDDNTLTLFEKQELSKAKEKKESKHIPLIPIPKTVSSGESKIHIYGGNTSLATAMDLGEDDDNNYNNDDDDSGVLEAYGYNSVTILKTGETGGTPKSTKKPSARLRPAVGEAINSNFSPLGYSPAIESKSVCYANRTKAGDSVLRYKCKDSDYWNDMPENRQPVKVSAKQGSAKMLSSLGGFKYMFQTATSVATILNDTLAEIGLSMLDADDKELQDLRVSSTEPGWYLGRIRTEEGKLSQGNTYLEGDLDKVEADRDGHIVSLDLSNAEEYRLFPGQVLMVNGKNELGKCVRVSEILIPPALPMPKLIPNETHPLNIIVACGPYTPIDSIQYEPLKDLIEVVKRDKPDLCILLGPFIDPMHPMIASGEVADTFEDLFEKIVNNLKQSFQDLSTQLVLIPSFRDAHHHQVYPSPPYSINLSSKIKAYPDPAIFEAAGVTFGITSTDILKHLAYNEINKNTITDRMGGLTKLILSQRNFYPLYPPDESVPLDLQLWNKYCKFSSTPHVLIMPSDLRSFIKDVDGTIVVNPERLTRGKSGGTYARLQIKLPKQVEDGTNSVADFCSGEIMKI